MATIEERYAEKFAKSKDWHERGMSLFAGGVTHQTRFTSPFPVYFETAKGAVKYDVSGNAIIDTLMGQGSLIMGHSPADVAEAVARQAAQGTHLAGGTSHEVRYAEAIKRLMPNMERIRFTSSGTESTYLALRLARAFTGKTKIIKFHEHFHGWHDYVSMGSGSNSIGGIPKEVQDLTIVTQADIGEVRRVLEQDSDIAAVIVECSGAHWGQFPLQNPQFLHDLQEIARKHGVVFIMDEVITGFRLSPGGAQERWNLNPDLTTMAKVMAGGGPGAAVGGRADIMEMMAIRDDPEWDYNNRVAQAGTYNAQPVAAVAGIAALDAIATQGINMRADDMAKRLKEGLNETFMKNEVTGHAHGISSIVHINVGLDCDCDREICTMPYEDIYRSMPSDKTRNLRRAMLVNGVDVMGGRGFLISSAHDEGTIDQIISAFDQSLKDLRQENAL